MGLFNFGLLKKLASVEWYAADPGEAPNSDKTWGELCLYTNRIGYTPRSFSVSGGDVKQTQPMIAGIMRPREVPYAGITGLRLRMIRGKGACLTVVSRGGKGMQTDYFLGEASQMRQVATMVNVRLKAPVLEELPEIGAGDAARPGKSQVQVDKPAGSDAARREQYRKVANVVRQRAEALEAQPAARAAEKVCRFCGCHYPAGEDFCPECGAIETI